MDYNDSLELLKSANGEVKIAIVMNKLTMNILDAREQIIKYNYKLRFCCDYCDDIQYDTQYGYEINGNITQYMKFPLSKSLYFIHLILN